MEEKERMEEVSLRASRRGTCLRTVYGRDAEGIRWRSLLVLIRLSECLQAWKRGKRETGPWKLSKLCLSRRVSLSSAPSRGAHLPCSFLVTAREESIQLTVVLLSSRIEQALSRTRRTLISRRVVLSISSPSLFSLPSLPSAIQDPLTLPKPHPFRSPAPPTEVQFLATRIIP